MPQFTRLQWRHQAQNLAGYYQRLLDEQGSIWAMELWMVRQWQRLIEQPNLDEDEVLLFAQAVQFHKNEGTVWFEVQYLVDKWIGETNL